MLRAYRPESTIAFCNASSNCRDLEAVLAAQELRRAGPAGDLEQRDRDAEC